IKTPREGVRRYLGSTRANLRSRGPASWVIPGFRTRSARCAEPSAGSRATKARDVMSALPSRPLDGRWKEALSLSRRRAPIFYEAGTPVEPGPHSDAIRFALAELRLAAVFCIEGVPTIGFLSEPNCSRERIDEVHRTLWNQGLMSLLLVVGHDELVVYSLVQRPLIRQEGPDRRLISTLSLLTDGLRVRELIDST